MSKNHSIRAVRIKAARMAIQTSTLSTCMNLKRDLGLTGFLNTMEIPDWSKSGLDTNSICFCFLFVKNH